MLYQQNSSVGVNCGMQLHSLNDYDQSFSSLYFSKIYYLKIYILINSKEGISDFNSIPRINCSLIYHILTLKNRSSWFCLV